MRARLLSNVLAALVVVLLALVLYHGAPVASGQVLRDVVSPTYPTPQNLRPCLHQEKEASEEAARRKQALRVVRAINTVQMDGRKASGRFLTVAELMQVQDMAALIGAPATSDLAPPGWQLRLAAQADSYVFALKDTTDPCAFAYFSDDSGLIYTAQPLR